MTLIGNIYKPITAISDKELLGSLQAAAMLVVGGKKAKKPKAKKASAKKLVVTKTKWPIEPDLGQLVKELNPKELDEFKQKLLKLSLSGD